MFKTSTTYSLKGPICLVTLKNNFLFLNQKLQYLRKHMNLLTKPFWTTNLRIESFNTLSFSSASNNIIYIYAIVLFKVPNSQYR